jgi:hypothetical protein
LSCSRFPPLHLGLGEAMARHHLLNQSTPRPKREPTRCVTPRFVARALLPAAGAATSLEHTKHPVMGLNGTLSSLAISSQLSLSAFHPATGAECHRLEGAHRETARLHWGSCTLHARFHEACPMRRLEREMRKRFSRQIARECQLQNSSHRTTPRTPCFRPRIPCGRMTATGQRREPAEIGRRAVRLSTNRLARMEGLVRPLGHLGTDLVVDDSATRAARLSDDATPAAGSQCRYPRSRPAFAPRSVPRNCWMRKQTGCKMARVAFGDVPRYMK